jgi:hypothetical protein
MNSTLDSPMQAIPDFRHPPSDANFVRMFHAELGSLADRYAETIEMLVCPCLPDETREDRVERIRDTLCSVIRLSLMVAEHRYHRRRVKVEDDRTQVFVTDCLTGRESEVGT